MSKRNYKSEIERLNKEVIDLKIEQHKKGYIHIPFNKDRLLCFIAMIGSGVLAWLNLYLLDWSFIFKVFNCQKEECAKLSVNGLINIYPILGEYILISLTLICLVAMFKGGFRLLNKYNEDGLINGLINGLISGLILGLISGLISGLIGGLIGGLISGLILGLIGGLILGLIFGLIGGLILGLIFGLSEEFN